MKEIKLSRDRIAFVDDDDYDELSTYKWYLNENVDHSKQYAMRSKLAKEISEFPGTKVYMHRSVLKIYDKNTTVKHKNGNTLDNRKENLYTLQKKIKKNPTSNNQESELNL
jgi:hypothetical protein